jgi:hypothetical protein
VAVRQITMVDAPGIFMKIEILYCHKLSDIRLLKEFSMAKQTKKTVIFDISLKNK